MWKPGGVIHALLEAEAFEAVRPLSPPREIGDIDVWKPGGVIHALRQAEAAEVAAPRSVSGYCRVDGDCGGGGYRMVRVFCWRWQGRGGGLSKARCWAPCGVVIAAAAADMPVTAEEGVVLYRIWTLRGDGDV